MFPPLWGPAFWEVIHTLSVTSYASKNGSVPFVTILQKMLKSLPCPSCSAHATAYMEVNPIPETKDVSARIDWGIQFHNEVNKRLGKKTFSLKEGRALIEETFQTNQRKYQEGRVETPQENESSGVPKFKHPEPSSKSNRTAVIIGLSTSAIFILCIGVVIVIYRRAKKHSQSF